MLHVLAGPDAIARDERVAAFKRKLGEGDAATLNTVRIDSATPFAQLQSACESLGFFVEQRLVIAKYWLTRSDMDKRHRRKPDDAELAQLVAWLPDLPETTDLLLIEDDELTATHPMSKLLRSSKEIGLLETFVLPADINTWMTGRLKAKGAKMGGPAMQRLAMRINRGNKNDRDHFAEDTRLYLRKLETELDKLSAYARGREITAADVDVLTAEEDVADIFKFTDAIAQRKTADAYIVARGVLARGESPLVIMTMLANQYRLMIIAKENERSSANELAIRIGMHPFPVQKAQEAVRRMQMSDLEAGLLAIAAADEAIKTGAMEDVVALDVLIAELGR